MIICRLYGNHLADNDVMVDFGSDFPLGTRGNYIGHNSYGEWKGNKIHVGLLNFVFRGAGISAVNIATANDPSGYFLLGPNIE